MIEVGCVVHALIATRAGQWQQFDLTGARPLAAARVPGAAVRIFLCIKLYKFVQI